MLYKNKNKNKIKSIIFYGVIFALVAFFIFNIFNIINKKENTTNPRSKNKATVSPYKLSEELDHFKVKSLSSDITVINYFDLDCVHCKNAYVLEDKNINDYIGKINIVYRHNPLEIHPLASEKVLIAECVYKISGEDNKVFFDFVKEVYDNFEKNKKSNYWVINIAQKYIDKNKKEELSICMSDEKLKDKISKQRSVNLLNHIIYTPTILVFKGSDFVKKYDRLSGGQVDSIMKQVHLVVKYYVDNNK